MNALAPAPFEIVPHYVHGGYRLMWERWVRDRGGNKNVEHEPVWQDTKVYPTEDACRDAIAALKAKGPVSIDNPNDYI